ncbi:hypothetical protein K438DRAFT_1815931 [Mycena galopus ATCC 62051]|nr:hypothetical protein K438DRAFT_1815931 [Mycena galopus ATCC 62051]
MTFLAAVKQGEQTERAILFQGSNKKALARQEAHKQQQRNQAPVSAAPGGASTPSLPAPMYIE